MTRNTVLSSGLAIACVLFSNEKANGQYAFDANQITLNGHDLLADSYNSTDDNRSTGGLYDPLKAGDAGNVIAEAGIFNSVGVGNVSIWGKLYTGTGYTLQIGPESSIGSLSWHQSGQQGIEPGFLVTDLSIPFPPAVLPTVIWDVPTGGTWDGEVYSYVLGDGYFKVPSLNLSGGEKMLVSGSACLYVSDDLNLKGNAAIRILPGATLKLYVNAPSANIRGEGILNEGPPSHLLYAALPLNTTINLRLANKFSGMIYGPQAVCYLTTKASAPAEFNGAFMLQELDLGAPVRLHYDEALTR